ncbi:MAG: sensor histidine kinase [Ruminococcus sp.]|nr:sensor histidine kinase [Ruminococcus sp.]
MNRLLDKTALLLLCLTAFAASGSFAAPVIALLVAVTCSGLVQIFSGSLISAAVIFLCSAMCLPFPIVFCAVPLLVYDALWEKKWWLVLPAAGVVFSAERLSVTQYTITCAGIVAACIIFSRVSRLEQTVRSLTELRDQVTEKNMQLAQQNRRLAEAQDSEIHLAALKERSRIAREIHDNVGHMLTRSLLQAGALMIVNKDERLKKPLAELKETLDSAMTSIRASVHDLHDDSIDLKKIVEDAAADLDERFDVKLDYDLSRDAPGKIRLCIAGVVKEALSNAVKHSSGDTVRILIREHPVFYQVQIEDNGACSEIKESGIGLKNMEERAAAVGGRISFTPSDRGFRIFMSIPKEKSEQQ